MLVTIQGGSVNGGAPLTLRGGCWSSIRSPAIAGPGIGSPAATTPPSDGTRSLGGGAFRRARLAAICRLWCPPFVERAQINNGTQER